MREREREKIMLTFFEIYKYVKLDKLVWKSFWYNQKEEKRLQNN